jgi:hypothetical protein
MIGGSYVLSAMVYGVAAGSILLPLSVVVDALGKRLWRRKR